MNTSKTPSRRHLLAAAMVGLAPTSLALWLTYPSASSEQQYGSQGQGVRTEKGEGAVRDTSTRKPLLHTPEY